MIAISLMSCIIKIKRNKYDMEGYECNPIIYAYQQSQQLKPLFDIQYGNFQLPLTYEDSLSPVPDHPSCAIGRLTSQAEWGSKKGTAFVVEDNYLLTCASNCYSHQHGQYPSITFTINSNRPSGYDIHKVAKVFIPSQYKQLSQSERNQYNYALLFIEGQPNMKDKYGKIGINFDNDDIVDSDQQSVQIKQGYQHHYKSQSLQKEESLYCNGEPLISQGKAVGLVIVIAEFQDKIPQYLIFNEEIHSQLAQWIQVTWEWFSLDGLSLAEMDASCLRDKKIRPIREVNLSSCQVDKGLYSFLEQLPFSHISELSISNFGSDIGIRDNLQFLKLDKFKNIKQLGLYDQKIGPSGCQLLASLSLCNLRKLTISYSPIEVEGCRNLSKADWPFLGSLFLYYCQTRNKGAMHLLQPKRRNLQTLTMHGNMLDNNVSKVFQKVELPRINDLYIDENSISGYGLTFLKTASWKRLTSLSLSTNTGIKAIIKSAAKGARCLSKLVLYFLHYIQAAAILIRLESTGFVRQIWQN